MTLGQIRALPSLPLGGFIKFPVCPAVYFIFELDELVYIGSSKNLGRRMGSHARSRGYGAIIRWFEAPLSDITQIEGELIAAYQPRDNKRPGGHDSFRFFPKFLTRVLRRRGISYRDIREIRESEESRWKRVSESAQKGE